MVVCCHIFGCLKNAIYRVIFFFKNEEVFSFSLNNFCACFTLPPGGLFYVLLLLIQHVCVNNYLNVERSNFFLCHPFQKKKLSSTRYMY